MKGARVLVQVLLLIAVVVVQLTVVESITYAQCTCKTGVSGRFDGAHQVLVGTVLSVKSAAKGGSQQGRLDEIEFRVDEAWKQDSPPVIRAFGKQGMPEPIRVGQQWLVFIRKSPERDFLIDRTCCSWTRHLDQSKKLGEYGKLVGFAGSPKKILD